MVVGVAKGADRRAGLEQLVIGREARVLKPAADDPGLHLVQQIRDEAHRFAISGHRGRRQKRRERSVLQDIEGVGPARRALLLKHFGGLAGILGAGVEELMQVRGIDRALAERIYAALHE
jgi:excinuclease ABC subunit C